MIQPFDDHLRRRARDEFPKYPLDDHGFVRFDLSFAGRHRGAADRAYHTVPIAEAAPGLAGLHTSSQTTARLVRKILQEQRVHRALQADVQMRDLAFGQCHDPNTEERQALEQPGGVFLIAAEPIEGFGEDDVELAIESMAHERLKTWTEQGGAGDGVIVELVRQRPSFAFCVAAADADLIRNRGIALVIGGVPCV